jgi:hypothetical protein
VAARSPPVRFSLFFFLVVRAGPFRVLRLTLRNQGIGNWLVSTLFAQISPIALGKIGWVSPPNSPTFTETRANSSVQKYYFVFASFNILVTIPTVWFLFPETSQKSLEDIDLLFGDRALGTLPDHIEAKDVDDAVRRGSAVNEKSVEVNQARVAEHRESI